MSVNGYRLSVACDAHSISGAERFLSYLLAELPPEVGVAVLAEDRQVLDLLVAARPGSTGALVTPGASTWHAMRRQRPDVLHVNLPTFSSCRSAVVAGLGQRVPVLLVDHLPSPGLSWRGRLLQRVVTAAAADRVAVGARSARQVEALGGLPAGTVLTIPNGVPSPPAHLAAPDGPRVRLGFLGRLDHQKGLDVLLRALVGLPEVDLTVVGDGPRREDLRAQVASLDLGGRVTLLGHAADPEAFWSLVDVLVLPSRAEAMPLVLLEALRRGRPVVATDVGSVAEIVTSDVGLLVPAEDADAHRAALRRVCLDRSSLDGLRSAATRRAPHDWSAAAMASSYDLLYRRAVRGRDRRSRPPLATTDVDELP